MKKFFKMFGAAALLAGMMMVGGCGDDAAAPVGKVVKGPVGGATVTYVGGGTAVTNTDGSYPYTGAAVTTTGGTYTDLNGVSRTAPNMSTPAGKANVTPLTTLFVNASVADQAKLLTLLGVASIDTAVVGTVSGATNVLVAKLNESLGEVLTQFKAAGVTPTAAYLQDLAAQAATLTPTTALVAANIVAAVNATTAPHAGVVINTVAVAAIADKAKEGAVIPATGSTGSTGTVVK